ncbi:MAG: FAD-dependent oxidoreductase, partial [Hyphomicrobiales bacterium]|nr:FAD-dependent oxidoreductase [Hyphomicrobiales bacterium]
SYIENLRQAEDLSALPVGRRVVVIGGGMTAIDIAVQIRRLGAEEVTIVYRRGPQQMKASDYECQLAQTTGVVLRHWATPARLIGENGSVRGVEFERTRAADDGSAVGTGETFTLDADMVFKAIGQKLIAADVDGVAVALRNGRIEVDEEKRTSQPGLWAGGDCVDGGLDLTVDAVEDGKIAAQSIHRQLSEGE